MRFQSAKLKDIVSLADSGTWGEDGFPTNGFPVLRSSNIQNFQLNLEEVAWRKLPQKDIDRKRLQNGDIIVTTSSGSPDLIGKCCMFQQPSDGHPYYFSNFTLRLRFNPDLAISKWVFYWLTSPLGRAVMESMNNTTSGLRNLNRNIYLEQKIPLPPLEEQKRIAAILDKSDAICRKRQQATKLADDFLRATFLDMFGDPVTNPKGWPLGTIRDLVSEVKYGTSQKASSDQGQYPIIRMNNITYSGEMDFTDLKYINLKKKEEAKYLAKKGDLLFNRTNSKELVGKTAVFEDETPMAIAGYLIRVRTNEKATPHYISAYLNSNHGKAILMGMCKNIIGMANINAQELQDIKILVPPVTLQNRYTQIVQKAAERKKRQLEMASVSSTLFSALTQRAFRGEL